MNGGIEKPLQRIGSTIKLSFVCSGGGRVEKEKKAEKEKRTRGECCTTYRLHGSGDLGQVLLLHGPEPREVSGGQRP